MLRPEDTTKVTIRPARPDEAPLLTDLAHQAKRYWGYPDRWIRAWRNQLTLTPADVERLTAYVAEVSAEPVGFYALEMSGDLCTLEHMWVRPDRAGRGIGRALFEHAVRTATGMQAHILQIDSDPHAEAFYLRLGARRVGAIPADMEGVERVLPRLEYGLRVP